MIAKYWRVRNKDAGAAQYVFQFQEIQLLDQSSANIVSQATVSGTNNYTAAIDGNVGTYWASETYGYNVGTNRLGRQFIQFNFPTAVDISAVAITPQQDNSSRLLVEFSHDGNIWFTIARDELTTLSGPRTIAIPAAPLVLDTVTHPYYAIRIWTNCSPTNPVGYDVYVREVALKDLAGEHLTPRTLYRLSGNAVSLSVLTNLFDDSHSTMTGINIYAQNAVANYNFATHGSTSGALPAQSGVLWCNATVPQILNTVVFDPDEVDGLSRRPKNISISYCDNKEPYSSYQDIAHWHDIAMVDDLSLIAGNICTLTGLATGNPRLLPAPPVITIGTGAGTYAAGTTVAVTLSSAGTAYYTLDGSTPSKESATYSGPIVLATSCTLKVIAYDSTGESASPVSSVNYIIDTIAPTVVFVKPTGTYVAGTAITATADEAATVYYSTDGSTPTTAYPSKTVAAGGTITLTTLYASSTVKYRAKDGYGNISAVQACYYRIQPTVTMNLPSGTYPECSVILSMNTTGKIYYTTDGTLPTTASNLYSASTGVPVLAGETKTIKAIAHDTSYNQFSDVISAEFTATVGARYWRFKVNSVYNSNLVEFKNLQFREIKGGSNIVTAAEGATIINAPPVVEGLPIGFDLFTEGTDFEAILALADSTITVDFGIPRSIRELVIDVSYSTSDYWPYSSVMQASVDGITWIDASSYGQLLPTNQYLAQGVEGRACVPVAILGAPDTYAPSVAFSRPSGNYPPGLTVELFSTEGTSVYYTTDGSEPTFASAVYSTAIAVNASTEIKAITKDAAGNVSLVASQTYNIKRAWTFWRYKVAATGTFVLRNLEFYSSADSSTNIVVAGEALVAGSVTSAGADPSLDTFNSGSGYEATFSGPFFIDVFFLNAEQEVVDIKSVTGNAAKNYGAINHEVYASDDAETWHLVKSMSNYNSSLYDFNEYGLFYGRVLPVADTVKPVLAFSPADLTVTPDIQLAFSCDKRARIRFTTNSDYDPTLSTTSQLPLSLIKNTLVRAIAWDLNGNQSNLIADVIKFKPLYKYWRLRFYDNFNNMYYNCAVYKLAMSDTVGGANIVTDANGVVVSATSVSASMTNFTGSPSLVYTTISANGACVQAVFPTATEIKEFTLDVTGLANALLRPRTVYLEASADGATWSFSQVFYLTNSNTFVNNIVKCNSYQCTPILTPVRSPGKYAANTVFKFDTSHPGVDEVIYTLDGSEPVFNSFGGVTLPTRLYDPAVGLSWGSGTKTLTIRAGHKAFNTLVPWYGDVQSLTYEEDATPASIAFSIPGGIYPADSLVTLTASESATIYYTTDGTKPTVASTVYTAPVSIGNGMRLMVIAVDTVGNTSGVYEQVYCVADGVPAVVFSKQAGEYLTGSTVELTAAIPSVIYYTTDGSTPTVESTVYVAPIVLDAAKTITAIAIATANALQSVPAAKAYTVDTILAHKFWRYRISKTYTNGYSYTQFYGLELHESVGGANVFTAGNVADLYSSPTYSGTVSLANIAYFIGNGSTVIQLFSSQNPSVTVEFMTPRKIKEIRLHQNTSNTNGWPDAFTLEFSDNGIDWTPTCHYSYLAYSADWGGSSALLVRPILAQPVPAVPISWQTQPGVIGGGTQVSINKGATDRLVYTTNGTEPMVVNGVVTNGTYGGNNSSINLYNTENTLRIKTFSLTGGVSNELVGVFTVDSTGPVVTPTLAPGSANYYAPNSLVGLSLSEAGNIWWAIDNSVSVASTPYTGPITIPYSCWLNVLAKDAVGNSSYVYLNYYIDNVAPEVTIGLAAGEYQKNTMLTASASDAHGPVVLRYTTDGTMPTVASSVYMAPGVPLVADTVFSVAAWDAAGNMSAVASCVYTLDSTPPVVAFITSPGVYPTEQLLVHFSISELGNVYYTIDGTEPTVNSALAVNNQVLIHGTATIKAIGIDACDNVSTVIDGRFELKQPTKVKLASAPADSMQTIEVTAGQTLVATDQNSLFVADGAAHVDRVADFQASPYQPLANRRVWHDTAEGVTKYNNGVAWVPTKSPTTPKDFGEF